MLFYICVCVPFFMKMYKKPHSFLQINTVSKPYGFFVCSLPSNQVLRCLPVLSLYQGGSSVAPPLQIINRDYLTLYAHIAEFKSETVTDMILVSSKITKRILNESNFTAWSKNVRVYQRSIEKDNHLTSDPPTKSRRQAWLRDDACIFLQLGNYIDSEVFLWLIIKYAKEN